MLTYHLIDLISFVYFPLYFAREALSTSDVSDVVEVGTVICKFFLFWNTKRYVFLFQNAVIVPLIRCHIWICQWFPDVGVIGVGSVVINVRGIFLYVFQFASVEPFKGSFTGMLINYAKFRSFGSKGVFVCFWEGRCFGRFFRKWAKTVFFF